MDSKTFSKLTKEQKKQVPRKELPIHVKFVYWFLSISFYGVILLIFIFCAKSCLTGNKKWSEMNKDEKVADIRYRVGYYGFRDMETLIKSKITFPETAKFSPDFKIAMLDVEKNKVLCSGEVQCKNLFNVPINYHYRTVFYYKDNIFVGESVEIE
jgi:hypothetical protein